MSRGFQDEHILDIPDMSITAKEHADDMEMMLEIIKEKDKEIERLNQTISSLQGKKHL